jgi:hypothetical protein
MADFDYESNAVGKYSMPPSPHSAGVLHVHKGEAYVDVSLAASDIVGLCVLPKGCVPTDFFLKTTDIDTGTSITISVGIAATARSDLIASTTFIATNTVGQAGGIAKPDAGDLLLRTAKAKNVDRIIAAKIAVVAGTPAVGYIRGEVVFRAAENDEWSSYPSSIASYPLV